MVKRKKLSISPRNKWHWPAWIKSTVFQTVVIGLLAVTVGLWGYQKFIRALMYSPYFAVHRIEIDPSLSFIDKMDLAGLKDKSIFRVDLKNIQRRLASKYPEVTQLKIVKRLPDTILILAKKRLPFAQTYVKNRTLVLDDHGVILSLTGIKDGNLPLILGLRTTQEIDLGLPLNGREIQTALSIIKAFRTDPILSAHEIKKIDVANLLKINLYLSKDFRVIMDQERISQKMKILGLILSQNQSGLSQIKYVDLRFKEPILGKK